MFASLVGVMVLLSTKVIILALLQGIHVHLACSDVVRLVLQTLKQTLVESEAWVLLLLSLGLSCVLLGLSVGWLLLLLLDLLLARSTVARASTQHGADTLVSDLGSCTEGHTCGHGAHKATTASEHTTSLLLLLGWCLLTRRGSCWGSSRPRRTASAERSTSTTS